MSPSKEYYLVLFSAKGTVVILKIIQIINKILL